MANRLVKPPKLTQTAEVTYVPAQPAYCVSPPRKASASAAAGSTGKKSSGTAGLPLNFTGGYMSATASANPSVLFGGVYAGSVAKGGGGTSQSTGSSGPVCYPAKLAVPGRPATFSVSLEPGWNAGAASRARLVDDFVFAFDVCPHPIGVLIGAAPANSDTSFATPEHAFYLRGDVISVVEKGVQVANCPFAPDDRKRLHIVRAGEQVTYSCDGWSYTSLQPSVGNKVADALLYSAGDYVDNPVVSVPINAAARGGVGFAHPIRGSMSARGGTGLAARLRKQHGTVGFTGHASAVMDVAVSAKGAIGISGHARIASNLGEVTLPGLVVSGSDRRLGVGAVRLPSLMLTAESGFALPDIGVGQLAIPAPMISGIVLVGGVGRSELKLPRLHLIGADYPYGQGGVELPRMLVAGRQRSYDPDGEYIIEIVYTKPPMLTDNVLYLSWREVVGVGIDLLVTAFFDDLFLESLLLSDAMSPTQILYAVLQSGIALASSGVDTADVVLQYATNLATGAVSRYEGFGFSSFFEDGLQSYAVSETGIHRIADGVGDDGAPLQAAIDFAAAGSESPFDKHLVSAFFGISTDGDVYLRATKQNGTEAIYRAVANDSMYRAVGAKGATSRHWHLRLELVDATYSDLDSVEWDIRDARRRHI